MLLLNRLSDCDTRVCHCALPLSCDCDTQVCHCITLHPVTHRCVGMCYLNPVTHRCVIVCYLHPIMWHTGVSLCYLHPVTHRCVTVCYLHPVMWHTGVSLCVIAILRHTGVSLCVTSIPTEVLKGEVLSSQHQLSRTAVQSDITSQSSWHRFQTFPCTMSDFHARLLLSLCSARAEHKTQCSQRLMHKLKSEETHKQWGSGVGYRSLRRRTKLTKLTFSPSKSFFF